MGQNAPANSCGPLKSAMIEGNLLTAPWLSMQSFGQTGKSKGDD
jgi:hypothetical protein